MDLHFSFRFKVDETEGVSLGMTEDYIYWIHPRGVQRNDPKYALLNWHFHPGIGRLDAHVHVGVEFDGLGRLRELHLPTGMVPFEAVIRMLIDRGVPARYEDWDKRLEDSLILFRKSHHW